MLFVHTKINAQVTRNGAKAVRIIREKEIITFLNLIRALLGNLVIRGINQYGYKPLAQTIISLFINKMNVWRCKLS